MNFQDLLLLLLLSRFSCVWLCATHRWLPTRLPRPWDSQGKNTGVGCHFLLQCIKVKSESEVVQSRPTLSDPMDHSPPGSPVHGIFQARVLEWGGIAFSETCYPVDIWWWWWNALCCCLCWPFGCSVTKSCPTLCDPTDCSTLGFPVLRYLPVFALTHVCWVGDAIPVIYIVACASASEIHEEASGREILCAGSSGQRPRICWMNGDHWLHQTRFPRTQREAWVPSSSASRFGICSPSADLGQ